MRAMVATVSVLAVIACNKHPAPGATGNEPHAPGNGATSPGHAGAAAKPQPPPLQVPAQVKPVADGWWKHPDACPQGFKLQGAPPPKGTSVWCADEHYVRTGPHTNWYKNGTKKSEGWEVHSEQVGPWREWYDNGQLARQVVRLPDDGQTGAYAQWNRHGKLLGRYDLPNGTGIAKTWHDNGKLSTTGRLVGGRRVGVWTFFREDGSTREEETFVAGKLNGLTIDYDEHGKRISASTFRDGKMNGPWTHYEATSGRIQRVDIYHNDEQTRAIYYQNGKPLGSDPPATACDSDAGLSRMLARSTGRGLDKQHGCVQRPPAFPGLILVGTFAYDRGCMPRVEILDCKLAKNGVDPRAALARAGWKAADPAHRAAIALRYIRQVAIAFSGSVSDKPAPPRATSAADGSVVVDVWLAEPSGMARRRTVDHIQYHFAATGEVTTKNKGSRTYR